MKRILVSALLVIAAAAVAPAQEFRPIPNPPVTKPIAETLRAAGNFKTFLSLLERAGLKNLGVEPVGFIGGPGPNRTASDAKPDPGGGPRYRTVFAPTDAAFARLPKGALAALKKDPARLRSFLLRHMVEGKLMVKEPPDTASSAGSTFKSVDGSELNLIWSAGMDGGPSLQIDGKARVGKFQDVMASDYLIVIHEIDAVLLSDGSV